MPAAALVELILGLEPEAQALIIMLVSHLKRQQVSVTLIPIPSPLPNPKSSGE